ncbi:MAG: helix-turn-helix domain-containing protein [Nocardiopsis sp. BM-2018]|nr:MAG: helix-turn-helix domain-containing protein [Nocardiopsis sp. BM-2018]
MPEVKLLGEGSGTFWRRWLARIPMEFDSRIRHAVDSAEEWILDGSVSLTEAARVSHLSVDRFRHLFTAQVGIPFSRFILWRRLSIALRSLAAGTDATSAAQEAGFADSPHLSRTVRAMFGVSLTELGLRFQVLARLWNDKSGAGLGDQVQVGAPARVSRSVQDLMARRLSECVMRTTPFLTERLLAGRSRVLLGPYRSDSLAVVVIAVANWRRRRRLIRETRNRTLGQLTDLELRLRASKSEGGHRHG